MTVIENTIADLLLLIDVNAKQFEMDRLASRLENTVRSLLHTADASLSVSRGRQGADIAKASRLASHSAQLLERAVLLEHVAKLIREQMAKSR